MNIIRVICQGCFRYGPQANSLMTAIKLARFAGWECSIDHGQPNSTCYCRRCSESIVRSGQ